MAFLLASAFVANGQSRDQNFPTAVTANEIIGSIKARDMGDSRLTSYYYVFDGGQGDIFINVVTKNFNGDIDVFTKDSLRPLTKIVIYADTSLNETGRLVYLRKSERLILRVEGRTPNDDPATFRIKFGGSFIAITNQKEVAPPTLEAADNESKSPVNSVGSILEVPAKTAAATKDTKKPIPAEKAKPKVEVTEDNNTAKTANKKPIVVIEEKKPEETSVPESLPAVKPAAKGTKTTTKAKPPASRAEKKPDPLASIRLIVVLKDGSVIERAMNEVSKFSVDKGILTIVGKDGRLSRFSILDVAKVTIE